MVRKESVIMGYFFISICMLVVLLSLFFDKPEERTVQSEYVAPEVSIIDIEGLLEMTEDAYVIVTSSGDTMELPFSQTITCESDTVMQPYLLVDKDTYTTNYQIHYGIDPIPIVQK